MDFVEIGNPGNAADINGRGSVTYAYNLGKYEISRDQVEKANRIEGFLEYTYFMYNQGAWVNQAAGAVSWYEAAKFVNYLNNSQGKQAAYSFNSIGHFQLWGAGQYSGTNQYRHKDAYYFLPSVDEWYKGAYYDPNKAGGAGYWKYPTGSNNEPDAVSGGTNPNTAVIFPASTERPADITNAGGLSPYGTMAQGGNVWEILETAADYSNDSATENRLNRGGSRVSPASYLGSMQYGERNPLNYHDKVGFRVAMIPEPSSLSLLLAGGAVLMAGGRRKV